MAVASSLAHFESLRTKMEYIEEAKQIIYQERRALGGWKAWADIVRPVRHDLTKRLHSWPDPRLDQDGKPITVRGPGPFWMIKLELWSRQRGAAFDTGNLAEMRVSTELVESVVGLRNELAKQGIELLFVPVPGRFDIYPEVFSEVPLDPNVFPAPELRAVMLELLESGIEVVDLFPAFRESKQTSPDRLLFHRNDPHLNVWGIRIASREIAKRLWRYPWVNEGFEARPRFQEQPGELSAHLETPLNEQTEGTPSIKCQSYEVSAPGMSSLIRDAEAKILIVGDSHVMHPDLPRNKVTQSQGRGYASVSAHIAKEVRLTVDTLWSLGGGPHAPRRIAGKGPAYLRHRKLIIWLNASYNMAPKFGPKWKQGKAP